MAIVNLSTRITTDEIQYSSFLHSSDSFIYVKGNYQLDSSGPDCLTLSVGECWCDSARRIQIDKNGLKVKPHTSVVIETKEEIALPLNIYGLLFGAGSNIYAGGFISNGKVDPFYSGKLKIGYHNGSNQTIILKPGDKLAYALFITTETGLKHTPAFRPPQLPSVGVLKIHERIKRFVSQNTFQLATLFISIISLLVSIIKEVR